MADTISILSELRSNYCCFYAVDEPYYHALSEAIEAVKTEPQIIKCGHCRYWRRKTDTYTQGFCDIWRVSRVRKDFCSEGRRKVDLEETDP